MAAAGQHVCLLRNAAAVTTISYIMLLLTLSSTSTHLIAALLESLLTLHALSCITIQQQHPEPRGEAGALAEAGATLDTHD
jgi:hypothetical protein